MIIYKKSSGAEQVLHWKPERFLRVRGFLDALFHKTGLVSKDSQKMLVGAFYERTGRELFAVQASALMQLQQEAGPKAARLRALRAQAVSPADSDPARSTAAARAARASAAAARQASEEQLQLEEEIRAMVDTTEKGLQQTYAEANAAVTRYSKATRFGILQSEIPAFTLTFDPEAVCAQLVERR